MVARTPPLAGGKGSSFLSQGNPSPEPAQELDKREGEEDPVAQAVAAARGAVGRCVMMGRDRRGGSVGEDGEAAKDDDAGRGLGSPVVDQPDLLGHGQGDEVGEPDQEEGYGEKGGCR